MFNQVATPLRYTPRKFVIHPQSNNLVIIESDHNAFTDAVKDEKKQEIAEVSTGHNVNFSYNLTIELPSDLIMLRILVKGSHIFEKMSIRRTSIYICVDSFIW